MLNLMKLSLLAAAVAMTTGAARPFAPAPSLVAVMPLAIIEAGTVSTLPKAAKSHTGKVVVLRGKADRAKAARARKQAAAPARTPVPAAVAAPATAPDTDEKDCGCPTARVSGSSSARTPAGASSADVAELRNADAGLRVLILGPDGLTRTRYVPAPPTLGRNHD